MLIVLMVLASCLSVQVPKVRTMETVIEVPQVDSKGPSWGRSQLVIGTLGVLAAEEYSDLILQLGMFQSWFWLHAGRSNSTSPGGRLVFHSP